MRLQLLVPVFVSLTVATAHAQPDADDGGPHAGNWSFEVNLPVDATFAANQTLIGVGGVELGLGERLTDRWYLGVTGGIEGLVGTNFEATNTPSMRLRGGVEARYTFHQGSGTVSVNDGPAFGVPRYDWIGANAGLESLDGGTTHGEYAELTLGSDVWLGRTQVGMYLKAGVSIEPNGAYGSVPITNDDGATEAVEAPPAQDASTTTTATYVALGWRLAFG